MWFVAEYYKTFTFPYTIRDAEGKAIACVLTAADARRIVDAVNTMSNTGERLAEEVQQDYDLRHPTVGAP